MLNGCWSSSSASSSWSNSVSTSPRRSGTLAIVRTPTPGEMRTQRKRRDHSAPCRLGQVEARGLRREQVGHVPCDQGARGRHADEDRARPRADRAACLLAQSGVGLVADHDRVGAGDPSGVAYEPLVGLYRDRALGRVLARVQGARDALLVAAVAQLAVELVNQVAAVREDQDAAGLRGLDEAERGHRLAGAGGVLEPEALGRVRVLGLVGDVLLVLVHPVLGLLLGLLLDVLLWLGLRLGQVELVVEVVVLLRGLGGGALDRSEVLVVVILVVQVLVAVIRRRRPWPRRRAGEPVPVTGARPVLRLLLLGVVWPKDRRRGKQLRRGRGGGAAVAVRARALGLGQQGCQRAREGVDLVGREHGAIDQLRLVLGEHSFQAEQQRELAPPCGRWVLCPFLQLGQRHVQRAAARRARNQHYRRVLALVQETLAHELLRSLDFGGTGNGRGRGGHCGGLGHRGSGLRDGAVADARPLRS